MQNTMASLPSPIMPKVFHTSRPLHYHHLYQIEHSFRTFKSYLETRPMFHWTNKRIEGHICLCYMAYSLLNNLQLRLAKNGLKHSEQTIRDHLSKMQVSLVNQGGKHFYLRSKKNRNQPTITTGSI